MKTLAFVSFAFLSGMLISKALLTISQNKMSDFLAACESQGAEHVTISLDSGVIFDTVSGMCTLPTAGGNDGQTSL